MLFHKRRISCMDYHLAMRLVDRIMETLEVIPETTGILMNWSDARLLNQHGCYMAAHTRTHPILSRISTDDARQEIMGGQQDINKEIGTAWPVFAYPSGHSQDCSDELLTILYEEGLKVAMTSIPGINVLPRSDLLELKRIGLSPRLKPAGISTGIDRYLSYVCHLSKSVSSQGLKSEDNIRGIMETQSPYQIERYDTLTQLDALKRNGRI